MTPVASVVVTAYRHERFVAQALKSVLEQRTSFDFEVIVGVDAAEDRTLAIAQELAATNPARLRVLPQMQRVGLFRNFAATYSAARGRFIALLEGDDYWKSPEKLAKQVALLITHPDVSLCGHTTLRVDISGALLGRIPETGYPEVSDAAPFLQRLCDFHTSSLCFPEPFGRALPACLLDERTRAFDLGLKFLLASLGRVGFVQGDYSAFRVVPGSASSSFEAELPAWLGGMIASLRGIRPLVSESHQRILARHLGVLELNLARQPSLTSTQRLIALLRSGHAAPGLLLQRLRTCVANQIRSLR